MHSNKHTPAVQGVQHELEIPLGRAGEDSTLSRRVFLEKAIGSTAAVVLVLSSKSLRTLMTEEPAETLKAVTGDACAEAKVACLDQTVTINQQDIPLTTNTRLPVETPPPEKPLATAITETTPPLPEPSPSPVAPSPQASPSPPPPQPIVSQEMAAPAEVTSEWELPTAERRRMSYQEFANNSELFISKLPPLETLQAMFPSAFFNDVEGQKSHIQFLNEAVQLDPDEYKHFTFNTSRTDAFSADNMTPKMLVWHWTGDHYETPDDIIRILAKRRLGVQGYSHHDHLAYKLVPNLGMAVAHSKGLNDFAMGLEVYSGAYDGKRSPLFSFTPEVTKTGLYASVSMLREVNLPINHATFMSHMAGDLIFGNPYYDPYSGSFHRIPGRKPPHVRKFDQPQEFMQMLVAKAQALDAALGPR